MKRVVDKQNKEKSLIDKYVLASKQTINYDLKLSLDGLNKHQVEQYRSQYGCNQLTSLYKHSIWFRLRRAFINPYSIVLFIIAIIAIFTDIVFAKNPNYTTFSIILSMLLISGIVRFIQELKSKKIADKLNLILDSEVKVKRDNEIIPIPVIECVVGDYIYLKAGDKVPGDIRIFKQKDLFVSESNITGESQIKEKTSAPLKTQPKKLQDYNNILFQGSNIISGECEGVILAVGKSCVYGGLASQENIKSQTFSKGSRSIIMVLIKFMLILVPIVFICSGLTQGNWIDALLFALSVAVGLTPELLPMVVTACLSKGSNSMRKKQTIVKNINAMEELGSMDTLCLDKTGTLTQDQLVLEYYMDILGNEDEHTLDCAYLSSYFSSGIKNHLDNAILKISEIPHKKQYYAKLVHEYKKCSEYPFDYNRKISTILLERKTKNILICKGPVDEIISRCNYVFYKNEIKKMPENKYQSVHTIIDDMVKDGIKLLAIGVKEAQNYYLEKDDENDLILMGYLAFFDAPKQSAYDAIKKLKELNINVKVLTGDNKTVTQSICKRLDMNINSIMTGEEFSKLDDNEAQVLVENTTIFAELSPKQKGQIISLLKSNGHSVGFMGDGLNDLQALNQADVSITVDNAAPSLKDHADVMILKNDLGVLKDGVIEGRKSFVNMSKYIKITASSNLGNILAIVICSIILPFFPMTSIQLLLLNLLYDILCLVIPFDNVDQNMLDRPSKYNGNKLSKFMLYFGPISSIFDVITFIFLFYYLCPSICGGSFNLLNEAGQEQFISIFQTGWFLESMWTQILILYLLRTDKLRFIHSTPSKSVVIITLLGIILFTTCAMTPLGSIINLTSLPFVYFLFLIGVVIAYLLVISIMKKLYIKRNGELL